MQKYKKTHDQCPLPKPTKHSQVTSLNSNKSLLKFSTNAQNKSTSSVQNSNDPQNHKSLQQKNKYSKHFQSHTFTTNTHQNSVNVQFQSTSHNNSKSNKKSSTNGKKSNGKKVVKNNDQTKGTDVMHGRSSSQYQNLSFVVKDVKDKGDIAKSYKNVLKARKQQKQVNSSTLYPTNKQPKDQLLNPISQPSKQRNTIKAINSLLTKKSINISSHKQLTRPPRQESKSHSKEYQRLSKKSQNSKKHLLTEISHTVTTKENNMNQGNSRSGTRRNERDLGGNLSKLGHKKRNISSASQLLGNQILGFENRQNNTRPPRHKAAKIEQYQKIPTHIFQSSTNSQIEYSNIDENTVKSYVKGKGVSGLREPLFYGQDDEIVFYKHDDMEEALGNERIKERIGRGGSRLELSSECLNCLTEPEYLVQPKGIRHLTSAHPYQQQSYSMKSSKPKSSSRPGAQHPSLVSDVSKKKYRQTGQLQRISVIKIQKVWRGYMTRRLLAVYIEEEEVKLYERMREFGRGDVQEQKVRAELENVKLNAIDSVCLIDNGLYGDEQQQYTHEQKQSNTHNQLDESSIPAHPYSSTQQDEQHEATYPPLQLAEPQINNSLNPLEYESEILPRDEQETISFLGQINNINLHGYSLIENDMGELIEENGGEEDEGDHRVMYTSVESVEGNRGVAAFDRQVSYQRESDIVEESKDEFGDKLVQEIAGYQRNDISHVYYKPNTGINHCQALQSDSQTEVNPIQNRGFEQPQDKDLNKSQNEGISQQYNEGINQSYQIENNQSYQIDSNQSYQIDSNQSYQIDKTLMSNITKDMKAQPRLFQVNESHCSSQQSKHSASQSYQQQQSSYMDPTAIFIGECNKMSRQLLMPNNCNLQGQNLNHHSYLINDESLLVDEKEQVDKIAHEDVSYVVEEPGQVGKEGLNEGDNQAEYEAYDEDSLQLAEDPLAIIQHTLPSHHDQSFINMAEQRYQTYQNNFIPTAQEQNSEILYSHIDSQLQTQIQHNNQNFSKSFSEMQSHQMSGQNCDQSLPFGQSLNERDNYIKKYKSQEKQLRLEEAINQNLKDHAEDSYQIYEDKPEHVSKHQSHHEPDCFATGNPPQPLSSRPLYTNKSNPNILIVKSPKNQFPDKNYFPINQNPNNLIIQDTDYSQGEPKIITHKKLNKQPIKKTSSLKEIFMKKAFFNDNSNLLSKDDTNFSVPSFANSNIKFLPYPTQKEATSIESLLHFRHQCLNRYHAAQFHMIQSQYIQQQITKEQFIAKLQLLAIQFESSALSIKQTEKDIFNGYRALLKLIKDVVKDCKTLGLGQEVGGSVRFCRSMELFVGDKSLLKGGKQQECVFGDDYLWRFDEVMIDEMEKSKRSKGSLKDSANKQAIEEMKQHVSQSNELQLTANRQLEQHNNPQSLQQQQPSIMSESQISNSNSIFSRAEPRYVPLHIQTKPLLTSPAVSSSSSEKQLSRQSLSHHHLPQLILEPREVSPDKPIFVSRQLSSNGNQQILDTQDCKQVSQISQGGIGAYKEEKIYQPCSFDISELGECEDEYIDDDEEQSEDSKVKIQEKKLIGSAKHSNDSSSYDIDSDLQRQDQIICDQPLTDLQRGFNTKERQRNDKNLQEISSQKTFIRSYRIDPIQLSKEAESYVISPKRITEESLLKASSNRQSLGSYSKLTHVIGSRNEEFSSIENQAENLLDQSEDQAPQENTAHEQNRQTQSHDSDSSLESQPMIKREVYQLSCDSDSDQEQGSTQPKRLPKRQLHLFGFQQPQSQHRSINRQNLMRRAQSFDCSQTNEEHSKGSRLLTKYNDIAEFIFLITVWQFIEEITLSMAKHQNAKHSVMGKRVSDYAKLHYQSQFSKDMSHSQIHNNSQQETHSNVVVITNSHKRSYRQSLGRREESSSRQNVGRIREDEIRTFLQLMYREMPRYTESQSKLSQRMYPNQLQLLRSLRDTQIDGYFHTDRRHLCSSSGSGSHSRSVSPSSEHVDSQTSYLELGSYEFLLSQQLCETVIEKYIDQVYEPEYLARQRMIQGNSETGRERFSDIKRQFNEYVGMRNMISVWNSKQSSSVMGVVSMNNAHNQQRPHSPEKFPRPSDFQTLIRTRQLFCQHKQLQSKMLRKEILKIQLHTILDSMNEQIIKERESKTGYSGIGLNELALGLIERTGVRVESEEEYALLIDKAKFRLEKFVLNSEVDVSDKLILECQESVTMNDSQWVFYVTEALQFGLEISKIVEEILWDQVMREVYRMMMKRRFTLENNDWEVRNPKKPKDILNLDGSQRFQEKRNETSQKNKQTHKPRKVISINIVVPLQDPDYSKQYQDMKANDEVSQSDNNQQVLIGEQPKPYKDEFPQMELQQHAQKQQGWSVSWEDSFRSKEVPFDIEEGSYHSEQRSQHSQSATQLQQLSHNSTSQPTQNQDDNDSYQLGDEEPEFDEDEQLEKELQNMYLDQDQQEIQNQAPLNQQSFD